jgi:hypothetical protein
VLPAVLLALGLAVPGAPAPDAPALADTLAIVAPTLDRRVLELALRAASCAERRGLLPGGDTLTVIDYSLPSTARRLWVLDLAGRALLHEELVAHGRGTGENYAAHFSNESGSHRSSLGLYATLEPYPGRHGLSLRLQGLEPGINDQAETRSIVMHGAPYVTSAFAGVHGRLGRSWGCPALSREAAPRVIEAIRGGTPLFVYFPDEAWLRDSRFLGACGAAGRERSAR